jgi:two-component system CheB/CheR fusion protein
MLTVLQANQTRRHSRPNEDFTERLNGRFSALASAHSILVESDRKGADLATLAQRQLQPHASDNPQRIQVAGEAIFLPTNLATSFGQVLHELATNAAKHGALSREAGTVNLRWSVRARNKEQLLTLVWA